ncbi:MAG TPA: hypothetical protein PK718_01990 [Candidatus Methanofastidiosa archaeon]|nr:hypothetical protein [Candidatus Methanofastidiosa archaeon]
MKNDDEIKFVFKSKWNEDLYLLSKYLKCIWEYPDYNFIKEYTKILKRKLNKYQKDGDDRALAIMGALIVENTLDELLSKWINNYNILYKNRDFSFSMKIDLTLAMRIIPTELLTAIDNIRKIRNVFAHNLDAISFEEIISSDNISENEKKHLKKIIDINKGLYEKGLENKNITSYKDAYYDTTISILLTLTIFSEQLRVLHEYLWEKNNADKLIEKICKETRKPKNSE